MFFVKYQKYKSSWGSLFIWDLVLPFKLMGHYKHYQAHCCRNSFNTFYIISYFLVFSCVTTVIGINR